MALPNRLHASKRYWLGSRTACQPGRPEQPGAILSLQAFPESGRIMPEVEHRPDLREGIDGDYRVIYRVDRDQIVVLTVRHSRQVTTADDLDS